MSTTPIRLRRTSHHRLRGRRACRPRRAARSRSHLAACATCRDQEAFERGLRERMRALPAPEVPRGSGRPRAPSHLTPPPGPAVVRWLPLAAGIAPRAPLGPRRRALRGLGGGAGPPSTASARTIWPREVWSSDAGELSDWYRQHGTELPLIPSAAGGVELVGGRFCPLARPQGRPPFYAARKAASFRLCRSRPRALRRPAIVTRKRGENVRLVRTGASRWRSWARTRRRSTRSIARCP